MNAGITDLSNLIASHPSDEESEDDGDSSVSKDGDESLADAEPAAKKKRLDEPVKNRTQR